MGARYDLDFNLGCQIRPDCGRISREERLYHGGHELYLAAIEPWLIACVSRVSFLEKREHVEDMNAEFKHQCSPNPMNSAS